MTLQRHYCAVTTVLEGNECFCAAIATLHFTQLAGAVRALLCCTPQLLDRKCTVSRELVKHRADCGLCSLRNRSYRVLQH